MIDRDELAAWLRLTRTPDVGRESARRLLAAFGSPERVFAASNAAWREVIGARPADALARRPPGHFELVDATLAWLAAAQDLHSVVMLGDPSYPVALFETADPPLMLYAAGHVERLAMPSIAIVGSRHPTPQGLQTARQFGEALAAAGFVIVSGLALGIDGAAHEGALAGAAGATIAVIGTGPDRVYPSRHGGLAHRIVDEGGLILTEFPVGTPPLPANFPLRNRVIAGLARGTLVVEAALRSGSLITARLALECGREVFAVPGSIHSLQARGCHALIRQGALLVESVQDILDDLNPSAGAVMATPVTPIGLSSMASMASASSAPRSAAGAATQPSADDPFLDALGYDPVSLDALVARTGESASVLNIRLLELELDGRVARLPGQLFQRIGAG